MGRWCREGRAGGPSRSERWVTERSEGIRANGEGCDRGLNGVETEGLRGGTCRSSPDEVPEAVQWVGVSLARLVVR